jgi:hypothetical protein
MSMLLLAGDRLNLLKASVAVGGISSSQSEDPLFAGPSGFPWEGLADGKPGSISKFASLLSTPDILADIDLIVASGADGTFDNVPSFPAGWTTSLTGTGAVARDTGNKHAGPSSVKLSAGTGSATVYVDVVVRTGSSNRIAVWLKADASSTVGARIQNQQTGYYWNGTTWTKAVSTWVTKTGAGAFTEHTSVVPVESYDTMTGPLATLRVSFFNATIGSDGWVDDAILIPAVDFCSIHGHNIDPRSAPELFSSDDGAAFTSRALFTMRKPSCFVRITTPIYARYWKLLFSDINSSTSGPIWMGELVLGKAAIFRSTAQPMQAGYSAQQVLVPRRFGAPAAYAMGQFELRSIPLKVLCESVTDRKTFFDEWRRCLAGAPAVVVPHDSDGHTDVIFGKLPDTLPHDWQNTKFVTITMPVDELPLPVITG